jgi:hypothetical protein
MRWQLRQEALQSSYRQFALGSFMSPFRRRKYDGPLVFGIMPLEFVVFERLIRKTLNGRPDSPTNNGENNVPVPERVGWMGNSKTLLVSVGAVLMRGFLWTIYGFGCLGRALLAVGEKDVIDHYMLYLLVFGAVLFSGKCGSSS